MWDDYYLKPLPRYYRKKIYGEQSGNVSRKAGMAQQVKHDAAAGREIHRYGIRYHCDMEEKRIKEFIRRADSTFKKNREI